MSVTDVERLVGDLPVDRPARLGTAACVVVVALPARRRDEDVVAVVDVVVEPPERGLFVEVFDERRRRGRAIGRRIGTGFTRPVVAGRIAGVGIGVDRVRKRGDRPGVGAGDLEFEGGAAGRGGGVPGVEEAVGGAVLEGAARYRRGSGLA